ncbi:hypothetical protein CLOBOL_02462 [Enterocloster bolteae ATCC BAA-613]|uniref:Uncharacterized protein n=1 Tax=Enterocloster bolteae (strain ATCC BAA-613 / DSM 15670 / CCUG 46953 / JCM 12243 / WAL 16351) TaxID=411902 RepID=A8RPG4_ENTBW|nr:hypothetical protein CLOBOL_02462 [Enterocloster bolteae ATCC BAA-613]
MGHGPVLRLSFIPDITKPPEDTSSGGILLFGHNINSDILFYDFSV